MAKQKMNHFTESEVRQMTSDTELSFSFYSKVWFDHIDDAQDRVYIRDKNDEKLFYPMYMFLKYAEPRR